MWLGRDAPSKEAEQRAVAVQRLDWDDEARRTAMQEANRLRHRDPEAAALLQAQALASVQGNDETTAIAKPSRQPYDPMRLYARLGRFYAWMSDEIIDRMDYRRFFGYVREMVLMQEEEAQAYQDARNGSTSEQEAGQYFTLPQVYEGSIERVN